VFEKISHQLTENSNLINSLACRLWVTYFENSTLGHTPAGAKATSIYGGTQPLDKPRELLAKVREHIPD
ncbi:hypothetical protein, partial [Pseudomonas avellanae]|uniref:hypothetical protein n=2 Tax=Pseudomonas avellanae TaxID=46257 RepID=UPI0005177632